MTLGGLEGICTRNCQLNIAEGIQRDRVLRGTREFSAELVRVEHMFDHPAHGMAKSSASLVGAGTPARRPAAPPPPTSLPERTEATPRPGPPGASPTSRPQRTPVQRAGGRGAVGGPLCGAALPFQRELSGWGSHPEELAEEAARLGLEALAITDHDGMYGIVRFAEAARALSLPTIFGAELTLTPAGPAPGRPRGRGPGPPTRPGSIWWCWRGGRRGMRGCAGPSRRRRWPGPRGRPGGTWGGWRGCTAGTGWC